MRYRHIPRTDLEVSEVGFGLWTVATDWWGRIEESDKVRLLQEAVGLGINTFDTADNLRVKGTAKRSWQRHWDTSETTSL